MCVSLCTKACPSTCLPFRVGVDKFLYTLWGNFSVLREAKQKAFEEVELQAMHTSHITDLLEPARPCAEILLCVKLRQQQQCSDQSMSVTLIFKFQHSRPVLLLICIQGTPRGSTEWSARLVSAKSHYVGIFMSSFRWAKHSRQETKRDQGCMVLLRA